MADNSEPTIPTLSEIRNETLRVFGRRPCLWQIKAAQAILKNDKDVICISGTGSGKTLTFWMPLLFRKHRTQIVVTPLNILGKQNVEQLARVGIDAVSISRDTATAKKFQDIEDGRYQAVVVNPEILLRNNGEFEKMWKNKELVSRLLSFVWDEAHCISTWNEFRGKYKEANRLRYLIPRGIPFFLASATLPPPILSDVMDILQIARNNHVLIHGSNDRPNVHISVRKILFPLASYKDLGFLIPDNWQPGQPRPPKFVIFFDNIPDSIAAADYLRSRLPEEYRDKIKWFNADNTAAFREDEVVNMTNGNTWGLCSTDSFGMGIDLPDIDIVVQWRASCSMCTLWQRFGRGARDPNRTAKAVFFVDAKYFDDVKKKKADAKAKRAEKAAATAKRKAEDEAASMRAKVLVVGNNSINRRALQLPPQTVASTPTPTTDDVRPALTQREAATRCCAERRDLYSQPSSKNGGPSTVLKAKTELDELEPAMDDLVNAATRRWKCFRIPSMVYFGNDKIVPCHIDCLPPSGCARCGPPRAPVLLVCCELCTPSAFDNVSFVVLPTSSEKQAAPPLPKGARRFKVDFKMDARDAELRRKLHEFRKNEMLKRYGRAVANNFGPSAIMPTDVLDRIVACAHADRIASLEHLRHEVKWDGVTVYGEQVVKCILDHRAAGSTSTSQSAPAPVIAPLHRAEPTGVSASAETQVRSPGIPATETHIGDVSRPAKVQKRTCRRCGANDHIASNQRCPHHPSNQPAPSGSRRPVTPPNENLPPPGASPTSSPSASPSRSSLYRTIVAHPPAASVSSSNSIPVPIMPMPLHPPWPVLTSPFPSHWNPIHAYRLPLESTSSPGQASSSRAGSPAPLANGSAPMRAPLSLAQASQFLASTPVPTRRFYPASHPR